MGQKIHPNGFRVGITKGWKSNWYADRDYARFVEEDIQIRKHIRSKLRHAGISKVVIERAANKAKVYVHAARPGMILGKRSAGKRTAGLDALRGELSQLVKRVSFRRAMKKAMTQARRAGAKGIRVQCSGRLGGAEMSRREWYRDGRVPLHTLRADLDYGTAEALTTYGVIGVKVWIFHGEILAGDENRVA